MKSIAFDEENTNVVRHKVRWLVLTNKRVDIQEMRIRCSQPFEVQTVRVLGGGGLGFPPKQITFQIWDALLGSPWTPATPILVDMTYRANEVITCKFNPD